MFATLMIVGPLVGLAMWAAMGVLAGANRSRAVWALWFGGFPALGGVIAIIWELHSGGDVRSVALAGVKWTLLSALLALAIWIKATAQFWMPRLRRPRPDRPADRR